MTREEYIDFANALKNNYTIDFDKLPEFCDMAISALENNREWIPVSEGLPDEGHEVYCQLSDGSSAVLYSRDNCGEIEWDVGMMGLGVYDVVAWREKPEPYQKGGE